MTVETNSSVTGVGSVSGGGGVLGPYADLAALIAANPAASNAGKTALVGAAAPYLVYYCDGSNWLLQRYDAKQSSSAKFASLAARAGTACYARKAVRPILDSMAGSALSAWGLAKMRAAYAGNCLKVRRVSDSAVLDIPFNADGIVATDLMIAFAGTSTLTVDTIYDQVGATNLTQATTGSQPLIDLAFLRNGMPLILMDGTHTVANAAIAITSTANCAVWTVLGGFSNRAPQGLWNFGAASQFSLGITPTSAFSVQPLVAGTRLSFATMQSIPNANGCVIGLNSAAGGMTFYRNNYNVARAAVGAAALTGVVFPDTVDTASYDWQGCVVFNAALSATDAPLLQFGLSQMFSAAIAPRANVVLQGDSIVASAVAYNHNYNKALWPILPPDVSVYNFGLGGQTLVTEVSESASYIDVVFKSGIPNVAVMLGGVNDIRSLSTAATMITSLQSWATARKAAGYKVLAATLYPRNISVDHTAPMEAQRVLFNTWLRANYGAGKSLDGIVDFELEPYFSPTWAAADSPDNLHPSLAGYLKATPILADAIINQLPGI